MLKITRIENGNVISFVLEGAADEFTKFDEVIGLPGSEIHVKCSGVSRINSVGIKSWINHFGKLKTNNVKVTLVDCSTALVEQMNMIVNFAANMTVESVIVPFSCAKCGTESLVSYKTDAIRKANFELPEIKCGSCGGNAAFDDIPEEYFNFLMR